MEFFLFSFFLSHKKLFSHTSLTYYNTLKVGVVVIAVVVVIAQNQNEEKKKKKTRRRRRRRGKEFVRDRESALLYTYRESGKGVLKRGRIHSNGAATIGRRIRPTKNERVFFV